jgi:hypothetical protein
MKHKEVLAAVIAILFMLAMPYITKLDFSIDSSKSTQITGAISYDATTVLSIDTGDTKGTIKFTNENGKSVSIPIIKDGLTIIYGKGSDPDERVYFEGETCTGTSTIVDCIGAYFLVIKNKEAHLFRLKTIDTEKGLVDIEDTTTGKEAQDNAYIDGSPASIQVGDITIIVTITAATNTVTFTSIGSSNNAEVTLYDRATLTLQNANMGSQSVEGFTFREYQDGALAADKYITDLDIDITYDSTQDSIKITKPSLDANEGSGWVDDETQTFYTNKGTLLTYDNADHHLLKISHLVSTTSGAVTVQPTKAETASESLYGVDTISNVGLDSAMTVDEDGLPHITYFDETNDALKYAYMGSSKYRNEMGWHVQTLDTGNVGRASDIALDKDNHPHIIYTDNENNNLKYMFFDGTDWHRATLDNPVHAILPTIALDSRDYPHIAYYDYAEDDLIYARFNGMDWETTTVDKEGDVGPDPSIIIDKDDNPHIAYFDNNYDGLKYAWHDGTSWNALEVDTSGTAGWWSSISVDENNDPKIWYYNTLLSKVMSIEYLGQDVWDEQTFSLEGFDMYKGDLVEDSNGKIHFSYYYKEDKDLRYTVMG